MTSSIEERCQKGGKPVPKRLSLDEEVLLAAADFGINSQAAFTAEDLVIATWKKFPDSFGMEGYSNYPDSNRVYTKLMGRKGLVGRGWLVKVGEKRYQLSEAGRIMVKSLGEASDSSSGLRAVLSRDQKLILERLQSSRVVTKIKAGELESVGFHDACSFWDISPRSNASTLQARMQTVESVLETANKAIRENGEIVLTQGGLKIGKGEIEQLRETCRMSLQKFKDDLDIIRKRTDERKFH
jgi:hypothetical protein